MRTLAFVIAVAMVSMACSQMPTPTPSAAPTPTPTWTWTPPTATPSPTPFPAVHASAGARWCLFDIRCSGLWANGIVEKAPPLARLSDEEAYWIDPDGPPHWQSAIRERVMPTLADWTGKEWRETETPGEDDLQWSTSQDWEMLTCLHAGGCAVLGDTRVAVRPSNVQHDYPEEVIYEIAIHEALHALWYAVHAHKGPMCNVCSGLTVEAEGQTWRLMNFPPMFHEVYRVYANPALRPGMSMAAAEEIVLRH